VLKVFIFVEVFVFVANFVSDEREVSFGLICGDWKTRVSWFDGVIENIVVISGNMVVCFVNVGNGEEFLTWSGF
jgi:hypothetical protein